MTIDQLKANIKSILYFEDTSAIDVLMASQISFRMGLGDKLWLILIGESSAGKSQLLRPLHLADPAFVHNVDDLTENTLLSGSGAKTKGGDVSLLKQVGDKGVLLISDMTVLFSKSQESRDAVLAQLRMVYDGEITKRIGTKTGVVSWKGDIQILSGATNSAYKFFGRVADMGERFLYYAMPPVDAIHMTRMAVMGGMSTRAIDEQMAGWYKEYQKSVIEGAAGKEITLTESWLELIVECAMFVAKIRTPVMVDDYTGEITHIPKSENPARVAKQIKALTMGLLTMAVAEVADGAISQEKTNEIRHIVRQCAWSMGSFERRRILKALCTDTGYGSTKSTDTIANEVGLTSKVIEGYLQSLAACGMVKRIGQDGGMGVRNNYQWELSTEGDWFFIKSVK